MFAIFTPMQQRKVNDQSMRDALAEMLQAFRLQDKYQQQKLIVSWERVMGKVIANRTRKIFFSHKKLFICVDSASLREELFNAQEKIKKMLNEEAGVVV